MYRGLGEFSKQVKTVEFGLNEYLERYVSEIKLVLQSGTLERSNGTDGSQKCPNGTI